MDKPEQILEAAGFDIDDLEAEGTILYRNPDYADCIVGVSYNGEVIYDFDKMINHLIVNKIAKDYDDAMDFIYYNASFGTSGHKMPIIMYPIKQVS